MRSELLDRNVTDPESDLAGAWDSFGKLPVGAVTLAMVVWVPFAARQLWPFLITGIGLLVLGWIYGDRIFSRGVFSFLDALDGLEVMVGLVAGIVVFHGLTLWLWRWVEAQDSSALTAGCMAVILTVVISVGRDLRRRELGRASWVLVVVYAGCVLWAIATV